MKIAFDIETIPNQSIIDRLPEPDVKTGNLKDPDKIAAKVEEAKAVQIERMALDPLTGRICCAAFYGETEETQFVKCIEATNDETETALIQAILTFLSIEDIRLITWNGIGFDLPFLFKRAMILNIDPRNHACPPLSAWTKRYSTDKHIDLMQVFGGWRDFVKLDAVAGLMFGQNKDEIDVTRLAEIMQTQEGRKQIETYCLRDTELTYRIYERALGRLFA